MDPNPAPAPAEQVPAKQVKKKPYPLPARILVGAAIVGGLLLAGAGLGQLFFPRTVVAGEITVIDPEAFLAAEEELASEVIMPDVVGLDLAIAERVILDSGVWEEITIVHTPAAGSENIVLEQIPAPHTKNPDELTLTVSASVRMPDFSGVPLAEAQKELEQVGAIVRTERVVRPDLPMDTVLGSDPQAGAVVPRSVLLEVSHQGEAVMLSELRSIDRNRCSTTDRAVIDGNPAGDSLTCTPRGNGPAEITWSLGRHADVLRFTLGVEDSGSPDNGTVTIIGDGQVLWEGAATYGKTLEVEVEVSGVLRLEVIAETEEDSRPTIVLGDIHVLTDANGLGALLGES